MPEDLDGEKATLHQLKMESEPLHQSVDKHKRLPSSTKIHHVRGWEVDANPRAADPTPSCAAAATLADPAPSPARMESGDEDDDEAAGAA